MNAYALLVFVHVLGAMGMFVAIGVEGVALERVRRAETSEDAGDWLGVLALPGRLGPIAMLAAVVSGFWMMAVAWSREAWMPSAFAAVVVMGILGGALTNRRVRRLRAAVAPQGALPHALRRELSSRALVGSFRMRAALAVGILALMTLKPGLVGSLLVLAATGVAGLVAAGVPSPRRRSAGGETAQA